MRRLSVRLLLDWFWYSKIIKAVNLFALKAKRPHTHRNVQVSWGNIEPQMGERVKWLLFNFLMHFYIGMAILYYYMVPETIR